MNRREARRLARNGIPLSRLQVMMARVDPETLTGQSVVNPGFSKRQIYDIILAGIKEPFAEGESASGIFMIAQNALREFGDWLPTTAEERRTRPNTWTH